MNTTCPCCKSPVAADIPICDLNTNTIAFGGVHASLQPQAAVLAATLCDAYPRTVTHSVLLSRLHGALEPDWADSSLKVKVSNLRRVLRKFGYDIKSMYGTGYRLEKVI